MSDNSPRQIKVYDGPSMIDGAPIIGLITFGGNEKLGAMSQLWILRHGRSPEKWLESGGDRSICGDCPHRGTREGDRTCYVFVGQAPRMVYRAYIKHGARELRLDDRFPDGLRLGAYGDPAAIPFHRINRLVGRSSFALGYTHQWHYCDQRFKSILMASVETEETLKQARSMGWRTFRVKPFDAGLRSDEVQCPNQTRGTNCRDCRLCCGSEKKIKSVAINVHGFHYKVAKFSGITPKQAKEHQQGKEVYAGAEKKGKILL